MSAFSIPDNGVLRKLQVLTNRGTMAEVLRDALAVYKFLVERRLRGHKIFVGPDRMHAAEVEVSSFRALQIDETS